MGQVVRDSMDLRSAAREVMVGLSQRCNQTVILCVEDNLQQVCIDKVDGGNRSGLPRKIGARIHLHAGASAKLLLAYCPGKREEYYKEYGLPAFTGNTTTDKKKAGRGITPHPGTGLRFYRRRKGYKYSGHLRAGL